MCAPHPLFQSTLPTYHTHTPHTHTLLFAVWVSRVEENATRSKDPSLLLFFSLCLFMGFAPVESGLPPCKGYFLSRWHILRLKMCFHLHYLTAYTILSTALESGTRSGGKMEPPRGAGPYPWPHKQWQDKGWEGDVLTFSCRWLSPSRSSGRRWHSGGVCFSHLEGRCSGMVSLTLPAGCWAH